MIEEIIELEEESIMKTTSIATLYDDDLSFRQILYNSIQKLTETSKLFEFFKFRLNGLIFYFYIKTFSQ